MAQVRRRRATGRGVSRNGRIGAPTGRHTPARRSGDGSACTVAAVKDAVRTGVCVVRAELDPRAGLRLTVTVVPDVSRPPPVGGSRDTVSIDNALDQVRRFLTTFALDRA
jgi:hypothetical protein